MGAEVGCEVGEESSKAGRTSMSEQDEYQNSVKSQYHSKVYFPGAVSAGMVMVCSVFSNPCAFVYQNGTHSPPGMVSKEEKSGSDSYGASIILTHVPSLCPLLTWPFPIQLRYRPSPAWTLARGLLSTPARHGRRASSVRTIPCFSSGWLRAVFDTENQRVRYDHSVLDFSTKTRTRM